MSDSKKQVKSVKAHDDSAPPFATPRPAKEHELTQSPEAILKEVQEREKTAAKEAEEKVQEALGEEARLKEPEVKLPPDVKDAGVVSPESDASEMLEKGSTIELPVSEEEYEKGEHVKISAKVNEKKEVFGVASIAALAMFVGRLIKMAHHHAKKIVFRKE